MNPRTSVPEERVQWTPQEVRDLTSAAFREMAADKAAAGMEAEARELERLADTPPATLDALTDAWQAQFGERGRAAEHGGRENERAAELEADMGIER